MVDIPKSVSLHGIISQSISLPFYTKGRGGVYKGPCPWCGGTDRFHLFENPPPPRRPGYWCRQCGRKGDAIDFLRQYRCMSFRDACAELGIVLPDSLVDMKGDRSRGYNARMSVQTCSEVVRPGLDVPSRFQQAEYQVIFRAYLGMRRDLLQESVQGGDKPHALQRLYLEQRAIPLHVAQTLGVGYVPEGAFAGTPFALWANRLVFLVGGPSGFGFIGRSLAGWEPGMTEAEHKAWLTANSIQRWWRTHRYGWFGYQPKLLSACVAIVEGPFDRLSLIAAGMTPWQVVATTGTEVQADWLPPQVRSVILGHDGDAGGLASLVRVRETLQKMGKHRVYTCTPDSDGGKDWSELWQADVRDSQCTGRPEYKRIAPMLHLHARVLREATAA